MTRRRLTEEELALWRQVAQQTARLHPERRNASNAAPLPKPKPVKPVQPRAPLRDIDIGSRANPDRPRHDLWNGISDQVARAPLQMDKKTFGKLKRGKIGPEGKIDLHGMTAAQAHAALTGYLMAAHGQGKRLVLVITGKGRSASDDGPIPVRRGVLKHQVPQWLSLAPLSHIVLQVSQAHMRHGGSGAYYVYLRRH